FIYFQIHKDSESYKDEFLGEYNFYIKTIQLLKLEPILNHADLQSFLELINFLASTSSYYPSKCYFYMRNLKYGKGLCIRLAFCKALVALRNRKTVDPLIVVDLFFTLVPLEDKNLRFILHLKSVLVSQNHDRKTLFKLQTFLFTKLKDSRSIVVRTAELLICFQILINGFRKGFLRDAKTANVLAECCFHKTSRIQVAAMRFCLGSLDDESDDDDDESENEDGSNQKTLKEIVSAYKASKKTRKKKEKFDRAKKLLSKENKSKKQNARKECNLLAIQYIYDPQSFVDKLFSALEGKKNEKFETRLLCMALCARMIGIHKLQTLSFYSYMHRYLQPKQREITRILLYVAQACHELVPPDIVEQLVYVIAQNFVSDRNTSEAITVGLNAIREIFASCPFAATEDLLRDLTDYKRFKNKNVSMAARGIITLFRNVNPKLLHRKDRGRPTQASKDLKFVEGAECLPIEVDSSENALVSKVLISNFVEVIEKAKQVCETRVLTQEDFRKINAYRLKKAVEYKGKRKNDDVKLEEELHNEENGLARLKDIERFHKKLRRETKEERMGAVKKGREGRDVFGKPKKTGAHVGRTNRELTKKKNFQMVRHKLRGKNRQRSFKERQESLRKYLLRQAGRKV
ncbi:unnamed protein product, partial [Thelazia callipaeda]|uniref:Protein SDA1 n=1 Tax=Thelazia callipaeda TaxID=103827 RepID=A0A0N5CVH9_THECL